MGQTKKILTDIAETVGEALKDSARQVAETVDPAKMIEQSMGVNRSPDTEFTSYLKNLGGELTAEEIAKKQAETADKDNQGISEAQRIIRNALPEHLRPREQNKPDEFEKQKQEEEAKKAQMAEAKKKQEAAQIQSPGGKQTGKPKRRSKTSDFEAQKNVKVG